MMKAKFDVVIRRGTVIDGTGGTPFEADIAIHEGKIAAVGTIAGSGKEEFDARNLLVTPGFVDIHTHFDGQAVWDSRLAPTSWHGVTTVLMGNCGIGFAPARTTDHEALIDLMEGVEDIPKPCLHEGLDWNWETYPEYLAKIAERPHDVDICSLLPHAPLRVYTMGQRALHLEPATPADNAQMKKLACDALRAGAFGFSTSRSLSHKTKAGVHTPTFRAEEAELTAIAQGMAEAGHGIIQINSDWNTPDPTTEFNMVKRVVRETGRPAFLSVHQRHDRYNDWRDLMRMCRDAANENLTMRPVVSPRTISILFGLLGSQNPFSGTPSYRAIADKTLDERVRIMRDPEFRRRMLSEDRFELSTFPVLARTSYERMFPFKTVDYAPSRESSVAAIAERNNRNPDDVAYDIMLEDDGRRLLFTPVTNYYDYNLDACREMLADPNALIGLSDGGAHVAFITDASFSTYLLSYWGRDRGEDRFGLPELIKRQCADNARSIGLRDRGILSPGMKADINIIDFDRLSMKLPYVVDDLPGGGSRLMQKAQGYVATFVSGIPTYRNGIAQNMLPGRLVRGPQKGPESYGL